jgi:alpha-N-arabinofuranosidase
MKNKPHFVRCCLKGFAVGHLAAAVLFFLVPTLQGEEGLTGTITVQTAMPLGAVNSLIFGSNVEAANGQSIFTSYTTHQGETGDGVWDPEKKVPVPEVVAAMKATGVKMLRYPGGCLVHNFNWKDAIGPVSERPLFTFGINEFLKFCRETGIEPLMTTSAYVGTPQDLADLVEYLNAPADDRHPWAQKRAADGCRKPWGVVYFEMGNESDHGNHDVKPFKKWTAQGYGDWFNMCAALMKRVDPNLKMGALMGTGTGPIDPWNRIVAAKVKGTADYIVVHTYAVGASSKGDKPLPETPDLLMRACMASTDQFEEELAEYRRIIRENTGKDIPLAITEYNAAFVNNKPIPYRYAFGPALFSADYIRLLLQPGENVLMANYWHFINGYWGMIYGPKNVAREPKKRGHYKFMPAYYTYRLWGEHFGKKLLAVDVCSPTLSFEGWNRTRPRQEARANTPVLPTIRTQSGSGAGVTWTSTAPNAVNLRISDYSGETHPVFAAFEAEGGTTYKLTFKAKFKGEANGLNLGIGLIDGRGWPATHSGIGVHSLSGSSEQVEFQGILTTRPDCRSLTLTWRLLHGGDKTVTAHSEITDLKMEVVPDRPPYAAVTSTASLSADGQTLYVMVFNKHTRKPVRTRIEWPGLKAESGKIWTVTGPGLEATNLEEEKVKETVSGAELPGCAGSSVEYEFLPRSMNALEIRIADKAAR